MKIWRKIRIFLGLERPVCVRCKYYRHNENASAFYSEHLCRRYSETAFNHVTGNSRIELALCYRYNNNGHCLGFEEGDQ